MVGITSYGGYIPRLRLNRMSIYENIGWFAPAIVMVAQGERSFCNWDEDSVTMAVAASQNCLKGLDTHKIDAVYLGSTTLPFADRLNAGIVKTALNLRDDIQTSDFTSSQRAGTNALLSALDAVKASPKKNILVANADRRETKTAYFYEMWFGDGAAAVTIGSDNVIAEFIGAHSVSYDFVDHYRGSYNQTDYVWEERWVRDEGFSRILPEAVAGLFKKLSLKPDDVDTFIFPCIFQAERGKIAKKIGIPSSKVIGNLHEECGETGTAHPLVMLSYALETAKPGDRILVCGFGQGCDALYFKVTDNITKLPKRIGVKTSLERKKSVSNYAKFLKFRELIQTEMGIRAEAPTQTAMTVLWRKRDMILGLVGGLCTKCNTPQFPRGEICVNPKCNVHGIQSPYHFSDKTAVVKSFTGDLLAVSVDPPAIYGMIQFEGGGRMMADFSDCEHNDISVGQKVTMAFRKRYTDKERGFTGYFWKAVPTGEKAVSQKATNIPEIRFDGKVAVVTGAGAGLGRVYALELAKRGAKLVINDLGGARDGKGTGSNSAADTVVAEIKAFGGEAVANYDSVATEAGGNSIVNSAISAYGRIDILINNAGILRDKTMVKMEKEDWEIIESVHLNGAYFVTKPAFAKMKEQGYGRIIVTTSAAGVYGNFGQTNYSAAKLGLVGFMNTLKLEGEKYNVKINAVAPIAATRMTQDILPPELFEKLKPEQVAPMVLYLCSETCAHTGNIINAGMGYYSRASMVSGKGIALSSGDNIPTVDDVYKSWKAIHSLEGAKEYPNAIAMIGDMQQAFNTSSTPAASSTSAKLSVSSIFQQMPSAFQSDKAKGLNIVFQYKISGSDSANYHLIIKDGNLVIESGIHSSPTTTILMKDEDFLNMAQGKLQPMQAFTTGKLKIEGDMMKSQLLEKLFKLK